MRDKKGKFIKGTKCNTGVSGKQHGKYLHGMAGTRIYRIWQGMKKRCLNKNEQSYIKYGAKGITVSKEWETFVNFLEDMKDTYFEKSQIDRIDNNKGYFKKNCRWVTIEQQANNKRNVKLYDFNGNKMSISQISRITGINRVTIRDRIEKGWEQKKAFSKPITQPQEDKNIYWVKSRKQYQVSFKRKSKTVFVGRFNSKKEAIIARNKHNCFLRPIQDSRNTERRNY